MLVPPKEASLTSVKSQTMERHFSHMENPTICESTPAASLTSVKGRSALTYTLVMHDDNTCPVVTWHIYKGEI
jgi:hypothetical protein